MPTLPWFEIFVGSYAVWVVVASISLLLTRRSPTATLAWIFAFIALPVVSGVYYVMFGPRRLQRRKRRYGVARAMASEVSAHLRNTSCETKPKLSPAASGLAAVGKRLGSGEPTFASKVLLLDDGDQKIAELERAVLAARHHIHMEYYIWEPDGIGTRFRDLLARAAANGIEVRVLYDYMGSSKLKRAFWKPLLDAGGEVLPFNAVGLTTGRWHLGNFRTHRKIAICDGDVGFLGGINLHDPAAATGSGKNAWHDQHVRIDGEPVRKLQRHFLENWTYAGGTFRLTQQATPLYFPSARQAGQGVPTQILASGPDDETAPLHAFFLAALAIARERVWIETPYLIPDDALESSLRIAVLRDVDVQVIVPKEGDSKLVTAASRTYCDALGRAGVHMFEYGPPMLHAKTMIVDDIVAVVGTANLDNRSFRLNFEVAAAFYDAEVIAHLSRRFEEDRRHSRHFPVKRRGPKTTQLLESIARLTSPVL
ncbi:MAG TPA: cardiolipin synthase [Usitatibacter sp.]|nr:cardiolipin synthase [Usitatibacter sp.]